MNWFLDLIQQAAVEHKKSYRSLVFLFEEMFSYILKS